MNITRRSVLKRMGVGSTLAALFAAGLLRPIQAIAAEWNKAAFESKTNADALKSIGASAAADSKDLVLITPAIAENGAVVPVSVVSNIPNTTSISFLVEKNPMPLACTFEFMNGGVPEIAVRLKFAGTSAVSAIAIADGKAYKATRDIKVTKGGCGG